MDNLLKEVQEMHDKAELKEIVEQGCDNGTSLIYYNQTNNFYDKHESAIWELIYEQAEDQGITSLELIASFNGQKDVLDEIRFKNLLCWYAIEEMARKILEQIEEEV
jgi:hypothetical protein